MQLRLIGLPRNNNRREESTEKGIQMIYAALASDLAGNIGEGE